MSRIRLVDIRQNDHEQAIAYYQQCQADGSWSADRAQSLLMLQDDPDALVRAIHALDPTVR